MKHILKITVVGLASVATACVSSCGSLTERYIPSFTVTNNTGKAIKEGQTVVHPARDVQPNFRLPENLGGRSVVVQPVQPVEPAK